MEEVLKGHSDTLASSRDPTDDPCGWTISFPLTGGIWWNDVLCRLYNVAPPALWIRADAGPWPTLSLSQSLPWRTEMGEGKENRERDG